MIITYNKNYRIPLSTKHWILYSDMNMKDSLIVWALYNLVVKSKELTFEELYVVIKERYKNKSEKSRCEIYKDENTIEIITKGTFPKFYIKNK